MSVIIPVYNVEKYIDESLTSVRAQTHRQLQIIIVDDGSTDGSAAIYDRHAADDDRILVLRQANAGQGAARNLGLLRATGRYVTFLDPDDLLPPDAYATLYATLEQSGSDFAVGSILRFSHGTFSSASWIDLSHASDRIGISIDDFPDVVMDVICCNRMLRRSFWDAARLSFPEGVAYEDHVPMMQAFISAQRFDVLRTVTYHWRTREDFSSTGQRKSELQNLRDRIAAKEQAAELLRGSSVRVRRAWLRRVLDLDMYGFLRQLEWADDAYWDVLAAAIGGFLAEADQEVLDTVRVTRKLPAWLLVQNRREHVLSWLRWQRENPRDLPTEVRHGKVLARFPSVAAATAGEPDIGDDIPEQILTLTEDETRLSASLRGVAVVDHAVLVLQGWAHPRLVDLGGRPMLIEAALVEDQMGLRCLVPIEPRDAAEANSIREHAHQDYRTSGFAARIDLVELARRTTAARPSELAKSRLASWRLELTCSVAGIVRTGELRTRDMRSSAGELPSVRVTDGIVLVPIMDRSSGFRIEVRRPRAVLTTLSTTHRSLSGTVRLALPSDAALDPLRLQLRSASGKTVVADLSLGSDGHAAFAVDLPDVAEDEWGPIPQERRLWAMQVQVGRRRERLSWSPDVGKEWWPTSSPAEVMTQRTERGHVNLVETRDFAVVQDVVLSDDQVMFSGRWLARPPGAWEAQLRLQHSPDAPTWAAESTTANGTSFDCVFRLSVDQWARGSHPPPSGDYLLQFLLTDGTVLRPRSTRGLVERTVLQRRGPRCGLRLRRGGGRQVLLQVTPPLTAQEESAFGQRLLRERYLDGSAEPTSTSVVLQVGEGEHASDSALALSRRLHSLQRDIGIEWSVADYSKEVPEGARTILMGSAVWHESLATADCVIFSGETGPSLLPRPDQLVLQTFRGYPFEPTASLQPRRPGRGSVGLNPSEASRSWTLALGAGPGDEADPASRVYGWSGPRLDVGWPRQDLLTDGDADKRRHRTREQLGLDDAVVLLWAPAWASTPLGQREPASGPLRLAAVLSALPPNVVVLLCGDVMVSRPASAEARVVDVRWYPRLDDLILASDVAATETTALVDDYSVTGRPQLRLTSATTVRDVLDLVDRANGGVVDSTDGGVDVRVPRPSPAAAVVAALWPERS